MTHEQQEFLNETFLGKEGAVKIRIMRSWEKQEEKRVYRMEQLRRLHDAWQDQVELWDMDLIELKD